MQHVTFIQFWLVRGRSRENGQPERRYVFAAGEADARRIAEDTFGLVVERVESAMLELGALGCFIGAVIFATLGATTLGAALFLGGILIMLMRRLDRLHDAIERRPRKGDGDDAPPPPARGD